MQDVLEFKNFLRDRPKPSGIDIVCKLQHFALITYAFDPDRFQGVMPERFKLDTVNVGGHEKALLSVVPFVNIDFTSAAYPFPKFSMGQTNYRIYIVDTQTNEKCVWFLGTTLDSWTRFVPHYLWKLPWHSGKITFEREMNARGEYASYRMRTRANWAPVSLEIAGDGSMNLPLEGFSDTETGLVYLTHPLRGYYHRRDGRLGTYHVWHKRLDVKPARLVSAHFGLLDRMGLVTLIEQQEPHSVLIEPVNEFTIYLPPKVVPRGS